MAKLNNIGEAVDALKELLDATEDPALRKKIATAIVALDGDVEEEDGDGDEERSILPEREEETRALKARMGLDVPQHVHREGRSLVLPMLTQAEARANLERRR